MTNLTNMLTTRLMGLGASGADASRRRRPRRGAAASGGAFSGRTKARLQFATWVKQRDPALYQRAIEAAKNAVPTAIEGLGDTAPSFWTKFTEGLTQLATASIALKAQRQVLDTNIQRAQQGLPPIDMSAGAPVIRTAISVDPATAARLQESAMGGFMRFLPWIAGGIGAYLLLSRR